MNVTIVRLGGIGDAVLALPVATAVRAACSGARISMLVAESAAPIFDGHPDVQRVKTATGNERLRDLIGLFRDEVDAVVFLMPYRRLMWAAWLAGVRIRVATGYRLHSILANRRVYQHRKYFTKHESEYNLDLLRGLGIEPVSLQTPSLVLAESERRWGMDRIGLLPPRRVVVHPGGVTSRRWSSRRYWDLACRMTEQGVGIVLTGSAAEQAVLFNEVPDARRERNGIAHLMGQLQLRELMAVIAASQALVSGSTGPAHLAAALGVPTVSLFDPRGLSAPIRWRPLGNGVVLRPAVPECPKCIFEACPYWDCLDRVTVDHVAEQLNQVFQDPQPLKVVQV